MESREQQSIPEDLQKKPLRRMMMLRFAGLGDAVFLNTIAYYYWKASGKKVILAGNHPEIFRGNPGTIVLPTTSQQISHQFGRLLCHLGVVDCMVYMGYQPEGQGTSMKPMAKHILNALGEKVGLSNVPLKPLIFLGEQEIADAKLPAGKGPWVAMHSSGITEMTQNKNWYPQRFHELAKRVKGMGCRVVQLGRKSDPALDADMDLRDKVSPRCAAAVLAACKLLVCQEGYLMHAATAVGTPAVVIYGGFIAPWESGYEQNINLFTKLPCSPCWLREPCPYDKECMKQIAVDDVFGEVCTLLQSKI
jgi:hypothetical protein